MNADTLATHFAVFDKLLKDNVIDARRLWNLDETGCTPGGDTAVNNKKKRYLPRHGEGDVVLPDIIYDSRVTMLPVVSADGAIDPPLFVFSGARMPYRQILVDGKVVLETILDHLPEQATIAVRDKKGVDSFNFLTGLSCLSNTFDH